MTQLALWADEKPARHARQCCDGACITHVLMPNMAYACGETILTVAGHFEMGTSNFGLVTCEGCRVGGVEAIRVRMRRQFGQCVGCGERVKDGVELCKGCAA